MGIEGGGGVSGAGSGIGAGVSLGPAISVGPSFSVGIETGGVAGGAASVSGSASLDIGPAFGVAPAMGNFGSSLVAEGSVNSLVGFRPMGAGDTGVPDVGGVTGSLNELGSSVPAGISFLEDFRPMDTNDINPDPGGVFRPGEIIFNAEPKSNTAAPELDSADALAEAELILSEARVGPPQEQYSLQETRVVAEPKIIREAVYWFADVPEPRVVRPAEVMAPHIEPVVTPLAIPDILDFLKSQPVISPVLKPETKTENATVIQAGSQTGIENAVTEEAVPLVLEQPIAHEQEVEEVVTERVGAEQTDAVEEIAVPRKRRFVVDKLALAERLREIGSAVPKAKAEAGRLGYGNKIVGWILGKFISLAHSVHLSGVVRPEGPDGTLSIIRSSIKAKKEFSSVGEVAEIALNNRPVSMEDDGEPVSDEEVRKVFNDRIVKPVNSATEIVKEKIFKKKAQKPASQNPVLFLQAKKAQSGITLAKLNMEQLFPKAA